MPYSVRCQFNSACFAFTHFLSVYSPPQLYFYGLNQGSPKGDSCTAESLKGYSVGHRKDILELVLTFIPYIKIRKN